MEVRRTKRDTTTVDMLKPGEVFEVHGKLAMRLEYMQGGDYTAAELVTGKMLVFNRNEEWEVTVIPGAFVPEG